MRSNAVVVRKSNSYGTDVRAVKLFFDTERNVALDRIDFRPSEATHLIETGDSLYSAMVFAGLENENPAHAVARLADGDPFLVQGVEKEHVVSALPEEQSRCSLPLRTFPAQHGRTNPEVTPNTHPSCFIPISEQPAMWLFNERFSPPYFTYVVEQTGESYRSYPLPQSTREDLRRQRPELYEQIQRYNSDRWQPRIQEWIEAHVTQGNRFWFGKGFYDGEGYLGVGAFGYFDFIDRTYTLFSPSAIADWSASAILVEDDSIWVGLVRHPEGADHSGGLLQYDRGEGHSAVLPVDHVISGIRRFNGRLYAGASEGRIYLISGDDIAASYVVEPALGGGFEIHLNTTVANAEFRP